MRALAWSAIKFVSDVTTSEVIKSVSAIIKSLVASLRHIVPGLLGVLLFWILIEMTYGVCHSSTYRPLAWLFIIVLVLLVVVIIWGCVDLTKALKEPVRLAAYSENVNGAPLAILDLALVLAAIFVSSQLSSPLTTPLLRFCQTIFNQLKS